jgi:hypothetical protein
MVVARVPVCRSRMLCVRNHRLHSSTLTARPFTTRSHQPQGKPEVDVARRRRCSGRAEANPRHMVRRHQGVRAVGRRGHVREGWIRNRGRLHAHRDATKPDGHIVTMEDVCRGVLLLQSW